MNRVSFDVCENFISDMRGGPMEEEEDNHRQLMLAKRAMQQVIREQLTPRQREVLLLYFFERRTIPRIAEELGVNKSTVSRTLARALRTLRSRLQYFRLR